MSTLRVTFLTRYPSLKEWPQAPGNEEFKAHKAVHCIKGDNINGYFNVKVNGNERRYDDTNKDSFVTEVCSLLAKIVLRLSTDPVTIVPVPNSAAVASSTTEFRTAEVARRIAAVGQGRIGCCPALRWKHAYPSSRQGGTRNPKILLSNLAQVAPAVGPIILYDDVMSTGGHLIACYRKLASAGNAPLYAIVMGKTIWEPQEPMLGVFTEYLEIEEPTADWPS